MFARCSAVGSVLVLGTKSHRFKSCLLESSHRLVARTFPFQGKNRDSISLESIGCLLGYLGFEPRTFRLKAENSTIELITPSVYNLIGKILVFQTKIMSSSLIIRRSRCSSGLREWTVNPLFYDIIGSNPIRLSGCVAQKVRVKES